MSWIPSYKKPGGGGSGPEIVTWSDGTDEQIAAMLEAHYNGNIDIHDYWSVGDTRTVSLSAMSAYSPLTDTHIAQDVTFVLMNEGGKTLSDGITECAFIVGMKDLLDNPAASLEQGEMHSSSFTWGYCARRTWCNNTFYNAIPNTLKPIFKEHITIYFEKYGWPATWHTLECNDYFALASEKEIYGTTICAPSAESILSQFSYYTTSSNRPKMYLGHGASGTYWTRSLYSGNDGTYVGVSDAAGTYNSNYSPSTKWGISPYGVI